MRLMFRTRIWPGILLLFLLPANLLAQEKHSSTVGMPARINQVVLPGPELEVRPLDDAKTPVIVRIVQVYPHGTAHRYDLEYYGLEPGEFDLSKYLRRKDGSPAKDLPALMVEIKPMLPPGQVEPHALETEPAPFLGGYHLLLIAGGVVWLAGLFAILFVGRRKKAVATAHGDRPVTLAQRLRPLVEDAVAGKLAHTELAELERLLLAFWQHRLHLEKMKPAEALAVLREREDSGGLMRQLENWLHRPDGNRDIDIAALLKPYHDLPADALERQTN